MAKRQLLENIFRFINILLYTDQFFHNDYLDFSWFEVKLNTFISIQNGGSKMFGGSSSFFKDTRLHHDINAVVKGH